MRKVTLIVLIALAFAFTGSVFGQPPVYNGPRKPTAEVKRPGLATRSPHCNSVTFRFTNGWDQIVRVYEVKYRSTKWFSENVWDTKCYP